MVKMDNKFKDLPLRNGVGIVVLNKENKIFVAKRIDNPKNFWQMPQGGVNKGEKLLSAALRELEEETGMKEVELIQEIEKSIRDDGSISQAERSKLMKKFWALVKVLQEPVKKKAA